MPPHPASPSNAHHTIQKFFNDSTLDDTFFSSIWIPQMLFPSLNAIHWRKYACYYYTFFNRASNNRGKRLHLIKLGKSRIKFSLGISIDYGRSRTGEISIIGIVEETPSAANVPANWLREWRHRRLPGGIYKYEWLSFSADFSRNYLTSRRYT